jgi:hypothetical protein
LKSLHSIRLLVGIDDIVMNWTQQKQILEGMPVAFRLVRIVAWSAGLTSFDVTDSACYFARRAINDREWALGKRATVSGKRE